MKINHIFLIVFCFFVFKNSGAQNYSIVGTGTGSNFGFSYPTPFVGSDMSSKHQFFITASHLISSGLPAQVSISSVGFNVLNLNGVGLLNDFTIKVYVTPLHNPLSSEWINSLLVAQTPTQNYEPVLGWNQLSFITPFSWDGVSNLVVETCSYNVSPGSDNASVQWTEGSFGPSITTRWNEHPGYNACTSLSYMNTSTTKRPNIRFGWENFPDCSSMADTGVAYISSASGCQSVDFILSASDLTEGGGISYQWQSAQSAIGPWSDIQGATGQTYQMNVISTTYFRLKTSCVYSGLEKYTNVVSYNATGGICECGPYPENYPSSPYDCEISSVVVGSMSNSLATCLNEAPGLGSIGARYANFIGFVSGPIQMQGSTVDYSVTQYYCVGNNSVNIIQIYVDWNQDGIFQDTERMAESPSATNSTPFQGTFTVPTTALLGSTRMRIVCAQGGSAGVNYTTIPFQKGEVEDYCFTVTEAPLCSGIPEEGYASISPEVGCPTTNFVLNATGLSANSGLSFQWQEAALVSGVWVDLPGATDPIYSFNTNFSSYYRMRTNCINSGQVNYTNPVFCTVVDALVGLPSSIPTVCLNADMPPITHSTTGVTEMGIPIGLPVGVTANWENDLLTISGIPYFTGVYNYVIPFTGICGILNAEGYIYVNDCAGLNNGDLPLNFSIYPNPSSMAVTIEGLTPGTSFKLMDIAGKTLLSDVSIDQKHTFGVEFLADGLYIIEFNINGISIREKLIKRK